LLSAEWPQLKTVADVSSRSRRAWLGVEAIGFARRQLKRNASDACKPAILKKATLALPDKIVTRLPMNSIAGQFRPGGVGFRQRRGKPMSGIASPPIFKLKQQRT